MTGYSLKLMAIVLMLIDHIGFIFFYSRPEYYILRGLGRLVFPIFAFLIAEGCHHTGNPQKYLARLLAFAFLSEPIYDKAFSEVWLDNVYQNIFFTLFLGAVAVFLYRRFKYSSHKYLSYLFPFLMCIIAEVMNSDYGGLGVALIFFLFLARGRFSQQAGVIILVNLALVLRYSSLQLLGVFSIIPLYFYSGARGRDMRYFFYLFYPAHLAFLTLLKGLI